MSIDLKPLTAEILARCAALGQLSEHPDRLTRTFLSPPMRQAIDLVAAWMVEAGMTVRVDAAGNVIGRSPAAGMLADPPVIVIGSHLDTVPDAGKYDGTLGVLLGVAAVAALNRAGRRLPCAVDVVGFSEEEGVRFRTPYLGSLAYIGRFDPVLFDIRDDHQVTMADALRQFGLDPTKIADAASPPGRVLAYLEAHIEQGPVLEAWDLPVGVVAAIVGQSRLAVTFEGRAGHAGTSPMDLRRDALCGAAEWILAVESLARSVAGLRGTVGSIAAQPGATNVVPGSATLSLDVRHAEDDVRERAVAGLIKAGSEIADQRGLTFRVDRAQHHPAVPTDPALASLLDRAVAAAGIEPRRLVSGAGHDAAVLAGIAPMAMLFLRSPGGISHHPDEQVLGADVQIALDVMIRWLAAVAANQSDAGEVR